MRVQYYTMSGGNSHQRAVGKASNEHIEKQVVQIVSKILGSGDKSEKEVPWYQTGLFWGGLTTFISIVVSVVAVTLKDVRWLLSVALPFAGLSWCVVCKPLKASSWHWRRILLLVLVSVTGLGLWKVYIALPNPDRQSATTVQPKLEHTHIQWLGPQSVKNYHLLPLKTGASALGFGIKNDGDYSLLSGEMGVATGVIPTPLVTKSFSLAYKDIQHLNKVAAMVAHPSREEDMVYQTYWVNLTKNDIKLLEKGDAQLCAVGTVIWSDSSGTYETYLYRCMFVQPDKTFNWNLQDEDNSEHPYQVH